MADTIKVETYIDLYHTTISRRGFFFCHSRLDELLILYSRNSHRVCARELDCHNRKANNRILSILIDEKLCDIIHIHRVNRVSIEK